MRYTCDIFTVYNSIIGIIIQLLRSLSNLMSPGYHRIVGLWVNILGVVCQLYIMTTLIYSYMYVQFLINSVMCILLLLTDCVLLLLTDCILLLLTDCILLLLTECILLMLTDCILLLLTDCILLLLTDCILLLLTECILLMLTDCDGKLCYNGGTLDVNTCQCKCQLLYNGNQCQNCKHLSQCIHVRLSPTLFHV